MCLVVSCLAVLLGCSAICLVAGRRAKIATAAGVAGPLLALALGTVPAAGVLLGGGEISLRWPWDVPMGSFYIALDALSAWFILPILLVSAVAAVYGAQYLWPQRSEKNLGASWFFYNILAASMLLVVLARNGVLFLLAWEIMSLASFFLVMFDDRKESVRTAGWTYLIATHLGTAFLFAMFFILGRESGSMDFDKFSSFASAPAMASAIFLLAAVGFGTKAGFMPFHVWLPEAHPAAPSHVSAVMSGVMIKTGIYGLLRVMSMLGPWQSWWGWLLVGIGGVGGVAAVVYALAQKDLKRLLAYSSVENIGIIALGLGLCVLGRMADMPLVAAMGFGGAMLHVLNHALFKSLLFLCAGSVLHATHTLEMDRLGGLIKKMPHVAMAFVLGSLAISGLPPFNGFLSEFLVYFGAYTGLTRGSSIGSTVAALAVIAALAMIGGLAAATFTKAFGIVFLGEPRTEDVSSGTAVSAVSDAGILPACVEGVSPSLSISSTAETAVALTGRMPVPRAMRLSMFVLVAACLAVVVASPALLGVLSGPVQALSGTSQAQTIELLTGAQGPANPLRMILIGCGGFVLVLMLLAFLRRTLLHGRTVEQTGTWDCGYAAPTARMQYTQSSFAQPITMLFRNLLGLRAKRPSIGGPGVAGLFPAGASFASAAGDVFMRAFRPAFTAFAFIAARLHFLQAGRVQLYVLYIAATLLILLVWKLA